MVVNIIIGESCSGKTTLLNQKVKEGYIPIIAYTTRHIRDNEVNGKDYWFITEEEFIKMKDEFVEYSVFNNWYYGTKKVDEDKDYVVILNPKQIGKYKECYKDVNVIRLKVSEEERIRRGIERGDKVEEIMRRLEGDRKDFEGV